MRLRTVIDCRPNQLWRYETDGSIRLDKDGSYSQCASVFGYSTKPGGTLVAANCHTDDPTKPINQKFEVVSGGSHHEVRVMSELSGMCLVPNGTGAGANIIQHWCGDSGNLWVGLSESPGIWTLASDSTLCVTSL